MSITQRTGAAGLALGLALLAGCGGGSEEDADGGGGGDTSAADEFAAGSAQEIAAAAVEATTAVDSLTLSGTLTSDGQDISIDLSLNKASECSGTIGVGEGTAEIISLESGAFLKGDAAFWAASAGEAQGKMMTNLIGEKWLQLSPEQNQFGAFCDLDSFLEDLSDIQGDDTTAEKGEVEDIDGTQAISLTETEDGGSTIGWVATEGEHFLIRVERTGEDSGVVDLGGFNEPVDVTEPDKADVVDLASLGG